MGRYSIVRPTLELMQSQTHVNQVSVFSKEKKINLSYTLYNNFPRFNENLTIFYYKFSTEGKCNFLIPSNKKSSGFQSI